ncbi:phage terminase small subunit P27 family [Salipaludibacillus sp. CF4.18]|uniref:phage terminase small subunit P27 family n=1 Tax=Salipaludibacillus sp. CF4.18 TaxID=3373081 RepID=UPI003EE7531E
MDNNIKAPSFLKAEAKKKFHEISDMLIKESKWKQGDEIALASLCSNYQRWIDAEKAIKQNKDLCFVTATGYRQQIPEISIANNAMKSMLAFIKEFGLTPRERAKLQKIVIENENENDDDDLEGMIV